MTKASIGNGKTPSDSKKARLAQALRDNLKRRKEQARERRDADSSQAVETPSERAGKGRRP